MSNDNNHQPKQREDNQQRNKKRSSKQHSQKNHQQAGKQKHVSGGGAEASGSDNRRIPKLRLRQSPLEFALTYTYADFLDEDEIEDVDPIIFPDELSDRIEGLDEALEDICPLGDWRTDEIYDFGDAVLDSMAFEVEESGVLQLVNSKLLKRYVALRHEENVAASQAFTLIKDSHADAMTFDLATLSHIAATNGSIMVSASHAGIVETMVCPPWTNTNPTNPVDTYLDALRGDEAGAKLAERFASAATISRLRFVDNSNASASTGAKQRKSTKASKGGKKQGKTRQYVAKPAELASRLKDVVGFIQRLSRCGEGVLLVAAPTNKSIWRATTFSTDKPCRWSVALYVVRDGDYVAVPSDVTAQVIMSRERFNAVDMLLAAADCDDVLAEDVAELEMLVDAVTEEIPWTLETSDEFDDSECTRFIDMLITAMHEAMGTVGILIPTGSDVVCVNENTLVLAEVAPNEYIPWFIDAKMLADTGCNAATLMREAARRLGGKASIELSNDDESIDGDALIAAATALLEDAAAAGSASAESTDNETKDDGNSDARRFQAERVAIGLGMLAVEHATLARCLLARLTGNLEQMRGVLDDSADCYDELSIRDDMTMQTLPGTSRLGNSIVSAWSMEAEYLRDIKRFNEFNGKLPVEKRLPIEQWLDACSKLANNEATVWAVEAIPQQQCSNSIRDELGELFDELMDATRGFGPGIEVVVSNIRCYRRDLSAAERQMFAPHHRDELRALATRCLLNEGGMMLYHAHLDDEHGVFVALGNNGDSYSDDATSIAEYIFGNAADPSDCVENNVEAFRYL